MGSGSEDIHTFIAVTNTRLFHSRNLRQTIAKTQAPRNPMGIL
jgi:hypothetical protein